MILSHDRILFLLRHFAAALNDVPRNFQEVRLIIPSPDRIFRLGLFLGQNVPRDLQRLVRPALMNLMLVRVHQGR